MSLSLPFYCSYIAVMHLSSCLYKYVGEEVVLSGRMMIARGQIILS